MRGCRTGPLQTWRVCFVCFRVVKNARTGRQQVLVWNPAGAALCRQFLQLKLPRYRHIMTEGRGRRDYVYVYVFDALRRFFKKDSLQRIL